MKVLLVVRWPVGGIKAYIRYIYSQDVFDGYEFTVVAPDIEFSEFIASWIPRSRMKLVVAENSDKALMKAVRDVLRRRSFDLIHSHGYSAALLTIGAKPFGSTPHIMTVHDMHRSEQFNGLRGKAKLMLINIALSRLDGVLTVGPDNLRNFKRFVPLVRARKVINIDHGVDVYRFFRAKSRDFRGELGLPASKKIVGFFGRFMSPKGFIDLVKAMKVLSERLKAKDMPLVLTFGWGGFIREDFAVIEQLGLTEYFIQLPYTDDIPAAIKGVDMVVMPSRWEACGLLAMEVLAAGTPLVGTSCIGLRCVLEDTPAHVVAPCNPDALAAAMERQLCADDGPFKAYQHRALERFNMERPALALHNYYQARNTQLRPRFLR